MTWSKLAGFVSLKAILVACCLTPVTVPATGITAAHAQFNIIIPGIQFNGYGGRRHYGRSRASHRSARRGGRRGQQQEVSGTSSGSGPTPVTSSGANTSAASVPLSSSPTPVTSSRGYRPSTD
jgi:hypothetical protein